MKRDVADGKTNYLLVRAGPMLRRWAELLTRGSEKYEQDRKPGELRNWQKAEGEAEYERFLESACRHFEHWLNGTNETNPETGEEIVEDHAAGVFFNINGAEYVRSRSVELTGATPESALEAIKDYTPTDPWAGTLGFPQITRLAEEAECREYRACGRGCCG